MNDELDKFKREIDLVEYAAGQGFAVDRRKSSTTTTIMRNDAGTVIGVSKSDQGHHIYSCFTDSSGGGSVIDFVKKIQGVANLGFVRKELRNYLGSPRPVIQNLPKPQQRPPRAVREKFLQEDIQAAWPMESSTYLASRGISQETLNDPRFLGRLMTDHRGNARFPHVNDRGLVGYEKKNHHKFKSYTKFGDKGLWMSNTPEEFTQIIVSESGVDALSHAQLHPENMDKAAYISIGGNMSMEQEQLLKAVIVRNPEVELISAFDNDQAGLNFHGDLVRLAGDRTVVKDIPLQPGEDWNQVLQDQNIGQLGEEDGVSPES